MNDFPLPSAHAGPGDGVAAAIHAATLTLDSHIDIPWPDGPDPFSDGARRADLPKMRRGGLRAACFAAYVPQGPLTPEGHAAATSRALAMLGVITAMHGTGAEHGGAADVAARICASAAHVDQPYILALPSFAATAFYHHKLANQPADLRHFLDEVEHFAMTDYAAALQQGTAISDADLDRIAGRLHDYTGLPVEYIKKADLRVNGGEFEQTLLGADAMDTGRLDSRFSGPAIDPLAERPDYDPQGAAMASAYISAFNDYARKTLHYGDGGGDGWMEYKQSANNIRQWSFTHEQPNARYPARGVPNVLPDLAAAMKYNPNLKVQLNQGYFDLGTPYFEGVYEMRHLPIPRSLAGNVEIRQYQSGHMVYAHEDALRQLHDNSADFIRRTANQTAQPPATKTPSAR